MKWTPFRIILLLNLIVIAGIYFLPYTGNAGGYEIAMWAMLTVLQVGGNLALAAVTAIISAAMGANNAGVKGMPVAYLICAGLVLLISFPLCFAMAQIQH